MKWDEHTDIQKPPTKKARHHIELSQTSILPSSLSDDIEDSYGTSPTTLNILAVSGDMEKLKSGTINDVCSKTTHSNLPGLIPSMDNMFTDNTLETPFNVKEKLENGNHSRSVEAVKDTMTSVALNGSEGAKMGIIALPVDPAMYQSSTNALESSVVNPETHASPLSSPQTTRSLKDFQPPNKQTGQNLLQTKHVCSKPKITGEQASNSTNQGTVFAKAKSDIQEEQATEDVKVESNGDLGPSKADSSRSAFLIQNDSTINALNEVPVVNEKIADLSQGMTDFGKGEAEFEMDSSPIQSSSEPSSDASLDDSDGEEDDYEMLDPEEQARRLMQEDGGSDDDAGKTYATGAGKGQLRTVNENPDEIVEQPDVVVTLDMKIEELGIVETIVENIVLIKAKVSGEYQVLETGSVLCLSDRKVIGAVAETLGRVQQPLYSVRFTNAEAISSEGILVGVMVFYVALHSTYVFTPPLKAIKGSDASNIFDEEVDEDELEFSDDEAELEHKQSKKRQRQKKRGGLGTLNDDFLRGGRSKDLPIRKKDDDLKMEHDYSMNINYDDATQDDGPYTPLTRPVNLHEMMNEKERLPNSRRNYGDISRGHRRGRGREQNDGPFEGHANFGQGRGRGAESRIFQDRKNSGYRPHPLPATLKAGLPPLPLPSPRSTVNPLQAQAPKPFHYQQGSPYFPQSQPNSQNCDFNMHRQSQYPSNYINNHQPNQAYQSTTMQGYNHPHSLIRHDLPSQPQRFYFHPQSPSAIPPGAYVNPAFFGSQSQACQGYTPQQQTFQQHGSTGTYSQPESRMSPESDAAFRSAQEKLNLLRQFSRGPGSPL